MEYITLHDTRIPVIGLGTWALRGKECTAAVLSALDIGYRHLDTAQMYANEESIGDALRQTDVSRDEIFITTKVKPPGLRYGDVLASVRSSLKKLKTGFVDLLLIHWPEPGVPVSETEKAMNELQSEGRVRHIGVSNFSITEIREAMEVSQTPVLTSQVHYDPFRDQNAMVEFCQENGVMLTAYSPLAKGRAADSSFLREIGEKYGKSAVQVTLRWLIQQKNVAAIPKSGNPRHQKENLDIFDFHLTREEMEKIFGL